MGSAKIVSEAFFRGQKPFGFNVVIEKVTKRTQSHPQRAGDGPVASGLWWRASPADSVSAKAKDVDARIKSGHDDITGGERKVCGLEGLDSKRFPKKSQERTQFSPAARRGWPVRQWALSARVSRGFGIAVSPTRRPRESGDPFDAAGIIRFRRLSKRKDRLDSRLRGNDDLLKASSNLLQSAETSAPAQILFDCEIAARRRPEPARRSAYNMANLISQYFPIKYENYLSAGCAA
jgi:hypothetical protein